MSWGLLKGFGQGLQSVGDTMMRDTLQRQREEWQRKYLEETRQKQWDREDTKDATNRERQLADTEEARAHAASLLEGEREYQTGVREEGYTREDRAKTTVFEKDDDGNEFEVVRVGDTEVSRKQLRKDTDLTERELQMVKGIDGQLKAARESMDPDAGEIAALERQRRDILMPREPLPEMTPTEKEYFDGLSQQYPNRSRDEILSKAKEMAAKDGQQAAPEPKAGDPPPTQQDAGPSWMERASNWVGSGSDEPGKKYGAGFDEIIGKPASVVGGLLTRGAEVAGGAVDSMNSNIEQHRALQEVRSAMSMNRNVSPKVLQMALPLITDPQEREKVLSLLSRMQ